MSFQGSYKCRIQENHQPPYLSMISPIYIYMYIYICICIHSTNSFNGEKWNIGSVWWSPSLQWTFRPWQSQAIKQWFSIVFCMFTRPGHQPNPTLGPPAPRRAVRPVLVTARKRSKTIWRLGKEAWHAARVPTVFICVYIYDMICIYVICIYYSMYIQKYVYVLHV